MQSIQSLMANQIPSTMMIIDGHNYLFNGFTSFAGAQIASSVRLGAQQEHESPPSQHSSKTQPSEIQPGLDEPYLDDGEEKPATCKTKHQSLHSLGQGELPALADKNCVTSCLNYSKAAKKISILCYATSSKPHPFLSTTAFHQKWGYRRSSPSAQHHSCATPSVAASKAVWL